MKIGAGTRRWVAHWTTAVALGVAVAVAVVAYVFSLHHGLREEISRNLNEVAARGVMLLQERIQADTMQLKGAAESVGEGEGPINGPQLLSALKERARNTNFDLVTVANDRGEVYRTDGTVAADVSSKDFFSRVIGGETVIADIPHTLVGAEPIMVLATPITRDGVVVGAVLGEYALDEIDELLRIDYFHGQGYNYIAKSSGEVLIHPKGPTADQELYRNIMDGDGRSGAQNAFSGMAADMRAGKSGVVFYEWGGMDRILNYMPAGVNDWYLLSVVPMRVLTTRTLRLFRQTLVFTCAVAVIFGVAVFYAFRQRRKSQIKLESAHQELTRLYNAMPGGVFRCQHDAYWTVAVANAGFYRFLGVSREEFGQRFHNRMSEVIFPDDLEGFRAEEGEQLRQGATVTSEIRLTCAGGILKWAWINAELAREGDGECFYCTFVDITPLKEAQETARLDQQRYEIVMGQAQDIIFEWNLARHSIEFSEKCGSKFDFSSITGDFPGCAEQSGCIHPDDDAVFQGLIRRVEQGEPYTVAELRLRMKGGGYLWCKAAVTALFDAQGKPVKAVGVLSDIQEQKNKLLSIEEFARRDSLTGLYNKGAAEMLVCNSISARSKEPAVLMMMDVDNFKGINDTYGHPAGDLVLKKISEKLGSLFRESDIIGRVGGDEFIIFLPHVRDESMLQVKADAILAGFRECFETELVHYRVTCSIGAAVYPRDGEDYNGLIRKADIALYRAKREGKNQYRVYNRQVENGEKTED